MAAHRPLEPWILVRIQAPLLLEVCSLEPAVAEIFLKIGSPLRHVGEGCFYLPGTAGFQPALQKNCKEFEELQ